jgi:cardiolipin synthase
MQNLNLANVLTLVRVVLAPLVVRAILAREFGPALVLFLIAGATDGLDGLAARRLKTQTRFGAYLDPIADKLLLSASFLAFGICGAVPWWLVALIFGRDLLILAMAGLALLFTRHRQFSPSVWGKISTFCQIAAALAVLAHGASLSMTFSPEPLLWVAAAATAWSGAGYVWRGVIIAREHAPAVKTD